MPAAASAVSGGNAGNMGRFIGAMVGGPIGAAIGGGIGDAIDRNTARRRQRDAYNASLTDRTLTLRGGVQPRRWVLGRVRIGGVLLDADTVGTNKAMLDVMQAMCDGPIDGVEGYWLNDEYFATSGLTGDRPSSGKYATPATTKSGYHQALLTSSNQITLPNVPVAGTVGVSLDLGADNGYTTVAVASIAGAVVTLDSTVSGAVWVSYQYVETGTAPLRVQWALGDQTAASTWAGVSTPNITATDVARGVAYARTLYGWDENLYSQGPPALAMLMRGVRDAFDPRYNLNPAALLQGAVVGSPGVLPTGVSASAPAGLSISVVASGTDGYSGLPYLDLRVQGTATASGTVVISLPHYAASPAAADGQPWAVRAALRMVAGTWPAGVALHVGSLITLGTWQSVASAAVSVAPSGGWYTASGTINRAGVTAASGAIRWSVTNGQVQDVTLRIALPVLWRTDVGAPLRWTSNPAVLAAWYATVPRWRNGCGRPWALVDWASVAAAANVCDELITVKKRADIGYEEIKRYECHTILDAGSSPGDNLRVVLDCMLGEFPFTGGKYTMFAGAFRAPTLTLYDDDISAEHPMRFLPNISGFDHIPTSISAEFVDAANQWREGSPPVVRNTTYIAAADGIEEISPVRLPATTDARQANYLMGVMLERLQPAFAMDITVKWRGADMRLLDGVALSLTGYEALAAMTWEVRGRVNNFDGTYTLRLAQTKANIWALDADRYTPTTVPAPPDLSYLWGVDAVTGLAVSAGQPTQLPDGTVVTLANVLWVAHSQDYVRQSGAIELRYRLVDDTVYTSVAEVAGSATATTITVAAYANARYIVEARARNGVGSYSAWVSVPLDVVVGSVASNITARLTSPGINFSANAAGVVQSYVGATTAVQIVVDGVDVTHLWAKEPTASSGITASMVGAVLTVTAMADDTAAGYVDILCTRAGWPDQPLRYGITKTLAGGAGQDALVFTLSNGNHTLPATSAGVVTSYTGAQTTIRAQRGAADETALWSYSIAAGPGLTVSQSGSYSEIITVTALDSATDASYVDITPSRAEFPTQQPVRFTVTKQRSSSGATGVLSGWFMAPADVDLTSPYSMSASITLATNGNISTTGDNPVNSAWYAPATTGIGSSHWVRFTLLAGNTPSGAALDTWLPLSSARTLTLSGSNNKEAQLIARIATDSSGTNVVGGGTIDINISNGL